MYTHTHTHTHTQTVYDLQLLPNNAAVKHFYTNRERFEVLRGIYQWGTGVVVVVVVVVVVTGQYLYNPRGNLLTQVLR